MLQGGMGFAAGGNINPEGTFPSMSESIHGSAPKYEGKGFANRAASIEPIKMLVDHLGEEAAAHDIEKGLTQIQGPPPRTPCLWGKRGRMRGKGVL
jgi:isocitrate/isopropylmalate dehydrogenase